MALIELNIVWPLWIIATSATWPPEPPAPSLLSRTPAAADATLVPCHGHGWPPLHDPGFSTSSAPLDAGERSGTPALENPSSSTASLTRLDVLPPIASARQASPVPSWFVYHQMYALPAQSSGVTSLTGGCSYVKWSSTPAPWLRKSG